MRLNHIALVVVLICFPALASAQFEGGDNQKITTVKEFKKQGDLNTSKKIIDRAGTAAKTVDKFFVLEGNIMTQVESNLYQFKDETGSINVEIKNFGGVKVEPDDRVRLFGEAEYDGTELILEVDRLKLVD
jgi:uncharacterized protein (TIGR00156 family)